jgi:MFS transporter, PPP family, 3-phenylpropionic acid transporter
VLLRKCCSYKRTILSTRRCLAASFVSSVLEIKFAYGRAEQSSPDQTASSRPRCWNFRAARRAQSNPEQTVSLSVDLIKFGLLFSTLYAAFGVASPFLPELLSLHGVDPERLGLTLSLATTIRLFSAPLAGRIADRHHALRIVLATCAALAAAAALGLLPAVGFPALLLVVLLQAAMLAPTTVLADALAVWAATTNSTKPFRFEYGWVRGLGSLAFVLGSLAIGQSIQVFGIGSIVIGQAILLLMAAGAAFWVPEISSTPRAEAAFNLTQFRGVWDLLRSPSFRWLIVVASLILGSHAMHDSFAMIGWNAAGISPVVGSALWSESVTAEVIVFVVLGPFLLRHLTPESAMAVSAVACSLRWGLLAESSGSIVTIAAAEPLHGLTFALLHLACMRVLASIVPQELAALALAIYGTVGIGLASAAVTLLSGSLYAYFGAQGFLAMSLMAAAALPAIWRLHRARRSAPPAPVATQI